MKKLLFTLLSIVLIFTTAFVIKSPEAHAIKVPSSVFTKGAFYLVQKVDNKYYNVAASTTANDYSVRMTPGSIYFNNGVYKGAAQVNFNVLSTNHSVITYANTTTTGFVTLKKMNISFSKGSSLLPNKTVQSTQWFTYRPKTTGLHSARYTTTDKQKWTPYITYRWDNSGLPIGGVKSIAQNTTQSNLQEFAVSDETPQEELENNLITTKNGNFFKPSENHFEGSIIQKNLTLKELNLQFYDETLEASVYKMKNYVTGDTVTVEDTVQKIDYNDERNSSEVYFESNNEPLEFRGDLTNSYVPGTKLSLSFDVVEMDEEYELNTINYIKEFSDTGEIPNISNFIQ